MSIFIVTHYTNNDLTNKKGNKKMITRQEIEEAKKEDVENTQKLNDLVKRMCAELEVYLIKKKRGYLYKLQKLLGNGNVDPIYNLEIEFFIQNETYLKKFNEIAKKYDYFFKGDIQNVLTSLTTSTNLEEDIKVFKRFLLINEIKKKDDTYELETEQGKIVFQDAKKRYPKETEKMIEEAKKRHEDTYKMYGLDYSCHLTALEFIKAHRNDYLITCMCPRIFNSTWWLHSYILTQDENTVIDFANNIIMERKTFNTLFEPNEVLKVRQIDFERYRKQLEWIYPDVPYNEANMHKNLVLTERAKQLQKRKNN